MLKGLAYIGCVYDEIESVNIQRGASFFFSLSCCCCLVIIPNIQKQMKLVDYGSMADIGYNIFDGDTSALLQCTVARKNKQTNKNRIV